MNICNFRSPLAILLAAGVMLFAALPSRAGTTFTGLGDLPGGGFDSSARDVSADGRVVVGASNSADGREAFRWEAGVITGLGDLPGGSFSSIALGVSADGAVVVGSSDSGPDGSETFRWEGGVMTGLGDLPGGGFFSFANAVSADGAVVVGIGFTPNGSAGFRWESGVMTPLADLPGGRDESLVFDATPDGAVIVGSSDSANGIEATRWEGDTVMGLGDLPGGAFISTALAISSDGSVIVGSSFSAAGNEEAFRWDATDGMVGLGFLPNHQFSVANDVSGDGAVIVGQSASLSSNQAFIWDAMHGMRNLRDVLTNELGLDLAGWTLSRAHAISPNGRAIVGDGLNPDGSPEAWRVLAEPEWTRPTSGAWDEVGNWGGFGPPPSPEEDARITPDTGLTVEGPDAAETVNTLTLGAQASGFAVLQLQPGGPLTTMAGTTIQNRGRLFGSGQLNGPVSIEAGGEIVALTGNALTFDSLVMNGGNVNVIDGALTFPGDGDPNGDTNDGLVNHTALNLINAEINGDIHSPAGSTINVGAGVVFNGLVSGAGNFPGAGLVTFNGGYSPGDSPAVIEMNGGVAFGSSNMLTIELGGLLPGEFDQLNVAGNALLDGTLVLSLLDGFTPTFGDQFEILNVAGTLSGQFAGLDEGALLTASSGSLPLRISYTGAGGNNVVLTAVPEPAGLGLVLLPGLMASLLFRQRFLFVLFNPFS